MTYHLVCHRHFFFLYRTDSEGVTLLGSERHWEPLVTLLLDRRALKVHILDNWSTHLLKVETTSRPLAIHEYAQWCWQKWRHIRQSSLFATVRILRRYNSILIAASPSNVQWMPLLEKLDQCAIVSTMSSYPMALILRLHGEYSPGWASLPPPLLVIVDRESHVLLAFLLKDRLVFIRNHTLANVQDVHAVGPKNMIMDTLRYLEKTFDTPGISPVFFLEDTVSEEMFRRLFPSSLFHFPSLATPSSARASEPIPTDPRSVDSSLLGSRSLDSVVLDSSSLDPRPFDSDPLNFRSTRESAPLVPSSDAPAFDRILLLKVPRTATMHLQGGIFQRSWVRRLVPYIRFINVLAILISVYSMYTAFGLMHCNQKMGRRLDDLHGAFKTIQDELSKMPISSNPIVRIQSIRKNSENQYKELIQHFALLEHTLSDRCLIRMISISPKKTRLSLQITDPTMVIDDLVDMGQNALSDFRVTLSPQSNSSLFVVETKSPFFYEKKPD